MSENDENNSTDTLSVSTDAMPVSPRLPQESSDQNLASEQNYQRQDKPTVSEQDHQATEPLASIPDPPSDWGFNIFLNKLADSLSSEDLSKMKSLFEGEGGIGKGAQEKIESPSDFFRILRTRGYISRDNILYLQGILFLVGRKDLIKDAVEYSRTVGNVLHLYAPSYQPENGYKYVKFHVAGKDLKNYSRNDVALLRRKVAAVLFVPEKFVIIMGIEPSSSLVITLMIPDMYVEILQELLEEGEGLADLQGNGVDTVEIDGKAVYKITGGAGGDDLVETEQHVELMNVYAQLQQTKIRLDNSEIACIDLSHQIENVQSEIDTTNKELRKVKNELHSLQKVLSVSRDETQPASLKELSSLKEFTESLHRIDIETAGKREFQRVLNATISIISTRIKERHKIQEQVLLLHLQDMQSQLAPLLFDLERYKLLTRSILPPFIEISLSDHGLQILATISSRLHKKEKEKLRQRYQWTPGGKIETFMEQDPNLFLAGIFYKEIETKQQKIDFETFVAECLSEVGREDLKKFIQQKSYTIPRKPDFPQHQNSQQQQRQRWQEQPTKPEQQSEGQQYQQQYEDQSILLIRMAQQIQEMYTIFKARQNTCDSKFEDWKTPSFPFASQAFQTFQQ